MARSSAGGGRGWGRGRGQDSGTCEQLALDAYETQSQHEISDKEGSDDDGSTVGRRGPVAPTPLPEPRNREWIWIIYGQFSNQSDATRKIGAILEAMYTEAWLSWKDVSIEDRNRMFERFKGYYQWENEWDDQVRSCWEKFIKRKFKDLLSRLRDGAKVAASKKGVKFEGDFNVLKPYKPQWMGAKVWEGLINKWNTDEWKKKSSQNMENKEKSTGGKHTLGSQTYVKVKLNDKELGRSATVEEVWMQSHGKKGTRPLDRLSSRRGREGLEEANDLEEIDIQNEVDWVDTRAKDSLISYQNYVKERHGDEPSKRLLFDPDSWALAVGGKKKGRLYRFNDIGDPHFVMTGIPSPGTCTSNLHARNEEVQQLNEKIAQLQQEKETERLEKEKEREEKHTMMDLIEPNRIVNAEIREENIEMKEQIRFLLKNIPKNTSN